MSNECTFEITVPDDLLERLASRVADLIRTDTPSQSGDAAESPWMTVKEAAAYLGCSRHTIYRHTAAKAIPFRKRRDGQGLLFRRDELDRWIEAEYEAESVLP
jgi:excisionase family DNA binding protein